MQHIDWRRVLYSSPSATPKSNEQHTWQGRPLLCTTNTEAGIGRVWCDRMADRLHGSRQCLLVSLQQMALDAEHADDAVPDETLPTCGLLLALTPSVVYFYVIDDDCRQALTVSVFAAKFNNYI